MQKTPVQLQITTPTPEEILQREWHLRSFTDSYSSQNPFVTHTLNSKAIDIQTHLRILGVSPRYSGHRFLLTLIPMFYSNPNLQMKEALPEVAKICCAQNAACVEHAIRTAIENAWLNCNLSIWAQYFPINRSGDINRPTCKEFIFAILQKL